MKLIAWALISLLPVDVGSRLESLAVEGHELHSSLEMPELDDHPIRHVPRALIRGNPWHSTDVEFVTAIARGGSQGNLGPLGIRSALYALYLGERELGFYGLEAESIADADRLEFALRNIWTHNVSADRAWIHRSGVDLVVVWTDGVSAECWEAVKTEVAERLSAPVE